MRIVNYIVRSCIIIFVIVLFTPSYSYNVKSIENDSMNNTVDLTTMANKIAESEYVQLYTPLDTISGEMTGYIYNCPLCTGRLACMSSLDLSGGTTTYKDADYGEVSIVASSKNLACGTIVSFDTKTSNETTYAIVLDRGVLGNDLDLLVWGLDAAYQIGRRDITYNVLRSGW